jgi:hypothetical protein
MLPTIILASACPPKKGRQIALISPILRLLAAPATMSPKQAIF